jgi:hypothetical protein
MCRLIEELFSLQVRFEESGSKKRQTWQEYLDLKKALPNGSVAHTNGLHTCKEDILTENQPLEYRKRPANMISFRSRHHLHSTSELK